MATSKCEHTHKGEADCMNGDRDVVPAPAFREVLTCMMARYAEAVS